ncbi:MULTISPECIES: hypothetical protein [Streptomyces]|uniref:Phage tail protein n=1 Tax=Streptomyces dengpaensis TaxID=2049881 RepID=A0ABM6SVD1_9ACTN|nr:MULTISPECIES: hypothetical protein [Streptomyces]AVH58663.1 hypothetical protein C4B68_26105 [Streptomyces dengpaensis]PIB11277.1 hypothetical protein B1C81_05535 [Streptomyces sp. HG99]
MSLQVLTGVRLFAVGADLTSTNNKAELSAEVEEKDSTTYGSNGWKEVLGGIASSEISAEGFWEAGDASKVDDASWSQIGGTGPWTVAPVGASVGDPAYTTSALRAEYKLLGAVGDVAPWSAKASGSWPVARGQIAHPPGTARTTTGTGTGVNLGAAALNKRLYAALHVLSVAGTATPTITARIESDTSGAFAAPTTRLTFTAATAISGEILRTSGSAINDTWWRVGWTITGTTPSFLFAVAFGIQ